MPGEKIGELLETCTEIEVEWIIHGFFSYDKEDDYYSSPPFISSGFKWLFVIYPNGESYNNSVGWVGLYLKRYYCSSQPSILTSCAFGIKRADGTVQKTGNLNWKVDDIRHGFSRFKKRSELLQNRSDLVPSDSLTIICILDAARDSGSVRNMNQLSQNMEDMFTAKRNCDVTIKMQNEIFQAHKFILTSRSPVFDAIFASDMSERNTGVVHIEDCHPEAFKDFLRYLYSGKIEIFISNALHLYKIADKYDVKELKYACTGFMINNLSVENLCDMFIFGYDFNETSLIHRAQEYFNEHFSKIFVCERWEPLLKDRPLLANQLLQNMARN